MSNRKQVISNIVKKGSIGINDLLKEVNNKVDKKVAKITIIRDLDELIKNKLVIRVGKGPAVKYELSKGYYLFEDIDITDYFSRETDVRKIKDGFNFEIFDLLKNNPIFNKNEVILLNDLDKK